MRSVKAERKQRGPRGGKSTQRSPRVSRAGVPQPAFGKRKPPRQDPVSRFLRGVRAWFIFRRPMLLLTASFALVAFIAALIVGGYVSRAVRGVNTAITAVIADAGFGISEVHIAGNGRTPPESILAALGFELGEPIFSADIQSARARLKQLPWVADAEVQRRYPDAIYVRLVEKLPFALWQGADGNVFVVERSGGIITGEGLDEFVHLPKLSGVGAPAAAADLVDAVAMHRAVSARVKVMQRQSERRWNLILDDGVIVKLPETGWQKQIDALEHLIVDAGILEKDVSEIDLRSPTHYFFILKSGEEKKVERGA
jgi:cell division protein FtsQ